MSAIIRILFLCVVMGFVPIVVTAGGSIPDYRVNGWTSPVDYQSTESCALFRQYAGHVGVDFCRNIGTEVRAIADGCVEDYMSDASYYGGTSGEGGGVILLRHTTSTGRVFYAVYGHNTPESSYLNERRCTGGNKTVKSGDIIARVHEYVGSSDHLHLGIHPDTVASEKYQSARCDKSDNCGWVDPLDFLMKNEPLDTSETLTLRCAFGYCWHPANSSDRCEDGTHHMAMTDSIVMRPVSKETACVGAWTYCRTLASGSEVSEAPVRNFWNWIAELRNNSRSDAPLWDMFEVCDSQKVLGAFTVRRRLDDSYEMVSQISHPSDLNAYPQRIELPILHANPHAYPDIRIWSVGVFDGSRELNEGKDHINPGGTYRINIYPVSEITDARNGTDDDIEHIETDTFIAYGISEEDLNWKFLCRSYTRVENLTENDPHKETCDVTIPTDMGGKRFYVKSKGDATGEVEEDDEGNNWSDEYKEWFPIRGNCNLIISWAGLDEGKTSPIKEGDKFGLKAAVQNIGSTACPGKSRISYELKLMGGAYTKVADDGVDSDQLMPGQTQWEHTMNEPFRASFISTYGLRVCADSTGANEESSESDNCYETTFDVQMSRSDLIVSDLYLRTSGGQIVRNGTSIPEDSTVHPYC
ncbi:MAG: M23 family metallopeptidase, partial [Candidatus Moranbacteria bacterium]|nr:M23 family metallopeptidase [Candidatus Moranbacteria bacterium]